MMVDAQARAILSALTFLVLCIAAVLLALLRLFGYIFFLSNTSTWAVVPALVLAGLVLVTIKPFSGHGIVAIALGVAYLVSVIVYGWADLQFRLSEGQSGTLDVVEALLILCFVARCVFQSTRATYCRLIQAAKSTRSS